MRLNVTLSRGGSDSVDLAIVVDATATVGDLAQHLAATDPTAQPAQASSALSDDLTLAVGGAGGRVLDASAIVAESGLASGATLSLARATGSGGSAGPTRAATLRVVSGPDAGQEFGLPHGASVIGRERGCEVQLRDPLVSRRHARVHVAETMEIVDLGSSNGVVLGGVASPRATLRSGDVVTIGDTDLSVTMHRTAAVPAAEAVAHVRSPRIQVSYEGRTFEAPTPPERVKPQRFPVIALIAPLLMGAVLFAVTQSPTSLIFIALSPVMMIGSAVESRVFAKRDFAAAVQEFEADLTALLGELDDERTVEQSIRQREHPSAAEGLASAKRRGPELWSRRTDEPEFGKVRLGLGPLPSRSSVDLPRWSKAPHELQTRLRESVATYATVARVPVVGDLMRSAVGVAGPLSERHAVARGYVAQLLSFHSPADVVVAGVLATGHTREWDWLLWTPHASSAHTPLEVRPVVSQQSAVQALLTDLERVVDERRAKGDERSEPAVLVVVDGEATMDHARMVAVAEAGAQWGIWVLWIAAQPTSLPSACRQFVDAGNASKMTAGDATEGTQTPLEDVERLTRDVVQIWARDLAPVYDAAARVEDDSDLPRAVSQLDLLGEELAVSPDAVIERWRENSSLITGPCAPPEIPKRAGTLRAVLGQSSEGPHVLDLRQDGPHALVGGTTGAGKSELLQSWILSLAVAHSPERVNFLLVDYKGGSAFAECVSLPHTIGLVTDLGPHEVQRALTSLSAELRYREELFAEHGAKDLIEFESMGSAEAPPSLIIVIDEFAALVKEVPEFIDGVVNVAQRGRSLGLHLILATQRPAGVIKDNLRANTNLRVALRMADEADSTDVLGTDAAASFDPGIPGRAMSKAGPRKLVTFQTAYAGGWTSSERKPPELVVHELDVAAAAPWEHKDVETPQPKDKNQKDISRVVRSIQTAAVQAELPDPRKAWLPMLEPVYDLAALPTERSDARLVFGVKDDPERQAQPVIAFEPDREGNLAVYGTGGAGKSSLLRTFAVAAGFSVNTGPCHVYGLDFGARGLAMLETLPHVGSIVSGSDHERLSRLLTWLRQLIDERALRYSRVNAATITDYRRIAREPHEPRILLLVDGIAAFRQAYDTADRMRWVDLLTAIASDGRPVGVHVILSSETRAGMTTSLSSMVQRRVVLRMATDDDYSLLGVSTDALTPTSPAGRGLVGDREIHVAVLGGSADVSRQSEAIRAFAEAMREMGAAEAPPIRRLPALVSLPDLDATDSDSVLLGLSADTLGPVGVPPEGGFVITGPPGSGRTTALRTLVTSLRRSEPDAELHLVCSRRSTLTALPGWTSVCDSPDGVAAWATALAQSLPSRPERAPRLVVVVEGAGDYVAGPADMALQQVAKACLAEGHWFVVEGEVSTIKTTMGFLGTVKSSRRGVVLSPDQETGVALFNTPFPRLNRADFLPGRGLLVGSGRAGLVQVATPSGG